MLAPLGQIVSLPQHLATENALGVKIAWLVTACTADATLQCKQSSSSFEN